MRKSIRHRCSAVALILAAGLYSTASLAGTPAAGAEASPPAATDQDHTQAAAKGAQLGVMVQSIDEDTAAALGMADAKGALVIDVLPNGAAAAAGLKSYDAILALNGEVIADGGDLARRISTHAPNASVDLKIKRAAGEQTITVKLGGVSAPAKEASAGEAPKQGDHSPKLGLKLMAGSGGDGVVIAEVAANSDAQAKGLATGDTILQVDGKPVSSPAEVAASVKSLQNEGRKAVLLLVKSGDQTRTVPVRFSVAG